MINKYTKMLIPALLVGAAASTGLLASGSTHHTRSALHSSNMQGGFVAYEASRARAASNRNASNVGPQPSAFSRPGTSRDVLPAGLQVVQNMGLSSVDSRLVEVASATAPAVYLAHSASGKTCVMVVRADQSGELGCNPKANPFQGKSFLWTSGSAGGPTPQQMSDFALAGIAAPGVARIQLHLSNGNVVDLPLNSDDAFLFVESPMLLQAGVTPSELDAYTAGGALLGSETVYGS